MVIYNIYGYNINVQKIMNKVVFYLIFFIVFETNKEVVMFYI